jgi:5-methylcytosine-specific restriction endonuclease McrA
MKKKTTKKVLKVKPRNAGTMTESGFWSFIRSSLRQKSRWWKPILLCKQNAQRKYNGSNKKQKYEYLCNSCKDWFPAKNINVDHIVPAGELRTANDLPGFVERLFCEIDNLQVLCTNCHDGKSKTDKIKYGNNNDTKL